MFCRYGEVYSQSSLYAQHLPFTCLHKTSQMSARRDALTRESIGGCAVQLFAWFLSFGRSLTSSSRMSSFRDQNPAYTQEAIQKKNDEQSGAEELPRLGLLVSRARRSTIRFNAGRLHPTRQAMRADEA